MNFEKPIPQENNQNEKIIALENKLKNLDKKTDRLGKKVDEEIKETVVLLNLLGINTSASCEGHIDRGIPVPWIDIEAENKPEWQFQNEKEIYEKVAKKYGLTFDEVRHPDIAHMDAWREAYFEIIKNGETEEFKEWSKENEKLFEKTLELLNEFYKNREVAQNLKLEPHGSHESIRLHSETEDHRPISEDFPKNEEEKKELEIRLKQYQAHMAEFTEFLKEKYLS